MSKFLVKANYEGKTKPVELERGHKYTLEQVRAMIADKHNLRSFTMAYTSQGSFMYLRTDEQLVAAIKEAERSKAKFLDIKVLTEGKPSTGSSGSYAPAYTSSAPSNQRPAQNYSAPNYGAPQSHGSPQHYGTSTRSQPASNSPNYGSAQQSPRQSAPPSRPSLDSGELLLTSFVLPADRNSRAEKVTTQAQQSHDSIMFICTTSKYDTDVAIALAGNKLMYKTTYTVGNTIHKYTQTYELPFNPSINDFEMIPTPSQGVNVKLSF